MKKLAVLAMALGMSLGTWVQAEEPNPRWRAVNVESRGQTVTFGVTKNGNWKGRVRIEFIDGQPFPSNMEITIARP